MNTSNISQTLSKQTNANYLIVDLVSLDAADGQLETFLITALRSWSNVQTDVSAAVRVNAITVVL